MNKNSCQHWDCCNECLTRNCGEDAMIDETRKLLTEYLGECWHDLNSTLHKCPICAKPFIAYRKDMRRTFTTREDMMDLYKAIVKRGEWGNFTEEIYYDWEDIRGFVRPGPGEFNAWLFCLSGDGYEEKCQMVVDWVKEASHES